ncbi:hypothetical protein BD626DRAFT_541578 [Schizophyllum amplum]|uniref:F-box domain-containing protein n=1 Tax=Schizophyllum amplum TaxID=97359 RepID=A0A550BU33_9AGAR|nr:hypothetical protein BD626DRAFT_541578 [Auriculariopsis ampla]
MPHNNDLLLALAACPALEKLMLSLHTDGDDDESALPVAAFPCPSFTALRELACLSTTPSPVQAILASGFPGGLGRRPMSRIETTLPIRTLEELATLLDAVHDYCDHRALETFYLHMLTHGAPVVLSRTALAPLAAFRSLVEITLAGIQTLALDDGDWEEVAGWWPRLAVFEINPYAKSRCPLSTLASFARHCPRLTSLQLPIDARVVRRIEEDDGVEEDGIGHYVDSPEMRLEPDLSIDVGDAPIVDSSGISEYLIAVFPNIVAVHFGVRDLDEEGFRIPLAQQDYTREQWQERAKTMSKWANIYRQAGEYYRQTGQ